MTARDYFREQNDEINGDSDAANGPRRKKKKKGGPVKGFTAHHRMDRHVRRQVGGPAVSPQLGAPATLGAGGMPGVGGGAGLPTGGAAIPSAAPAGGIVPQIPTGAGAIGRGVGTANPLGGAAGVPMGGAGAGAGLGGAGVGAGVRPPGMRGGGRAAKLPANPIRQGKVLSEPGGGKYQGGGTVDPTFGYSPRMLRDPHSFDSEVGEGGGAGSSLGRAPATLDPGGLGMGGRRAMRTPTLDEYRQGGEVPPYGDPRGLTPRYRPEQRDALHSQAGYPPVDMADIPPGMPYRDPPPPDHLEMPPRRRGSEPPLPMQPQARGGEVGQRRHRYAPGQRSQGPFGQMMPRQNDAIPGPPSYAEPPDPNGMAQEPPLRQGSAPPMPPMKRGGRLPERLEKDKWNGKKPPQRHQAGGGVGVRVPHNPVGERLGRGVGGTGLGTIGGGGVLPTRVTPRTIAPVSRMGEGIGRAGFADGGNTGERPRRQRGGRAPADTEDHLQAGGRAADYSMSPQGYQVGGRTDAVGGRYGTADDDRWGQKWMPGHGDEDTTRIDRSRGRPIREGQVPTIGGRYGEQDGVGPGDNVSDYTIPATRAARGGRLSAQERRDLPSSDYALPGKGKGLGGKGPGSYPLPDERHARSALSLVSQHGTASEKARVRADVRKKFPGISQSKSGGGRSC